jgi:hypothetical protein
MLMPFLYTDYVENGVSYVGAGKLPLLLTELETIALGIAP